MYWSQKKGRQQVVWEGRLCLDWQTKLTSTYNGPFVAGPDHMEKFAQDPVVVAKFKDAALQRNDGSASEISQRE